MRRALPILVTTLAGALAAQLPTHVAPVPASLILGNTSSGIPFASTPTHYQQVIDRAALSNHAAATFTRLRLRMASGQTQKPGQTIEVELFLAESPNNAASASTVFANNVSPSTEVSVFQRRQVLLPTVPDNGWAVAPFPFDAPFGFTGSSHLSLRAVVWGNSNNNSAFSYPLDVFSGSGASSLQVGTGCMANHGRGAATHTLAVGGLVPGGNASYTGNSFVVQGGNPGMLAIGTSDQRFGGVPLPFDLTPLGAPGCALFNDWLLLLPFVAPNDGRVSVPLALPNDQALVWSRHFSQFVWLDAFANALGVFTSNGRENLIGSPNQVGMARISAANNPGATSGTLTANYGLAIGFD